MATDATGTPTSNGIPKFQTNIDNPSGKGFNAAMDAIDTLITSALKTVWKKAGSTVGTRRGINFIDGSNITITAVDNSGSDQVDVTIAATVSSSSINGVGLLSARPSAATAGSGATYFATDQVVDYISDGSTWIRKSAPAGTTVEWHSTASVPTGWVAYDGGTLPASTGIYADLFAHLGSTTKPDTRGRISVAQGTHSDVSTIGGTDGLAVGSRRVKHKHTVNDTGHTHPEKGNDQGATGTPNGNRFPQGTDQNPAGQITYNVSTASATTGITIGPQTGSEPTDGAAWIVCLKLAKL